nr:uncharacterized protein LOC124494162 isoform X2 [Dermatophagoides farinae]
MILESAEDMTNSTENEMMNNSSTISSFTFENEISETFTDGGVDAGAGQNDGSSIDFRMISAIITIVALLIIGGWALKSRFSKKRKSPGSSKPPASGLDNQKTGKFISKTENVQSSSTASATRSITPTVVTTGGSSDGGGGGGSTAVTVTPKQEGFTAAVGEGITVTVKQITN